VLRRAVPFICRDGESPQRTPTFVEAGAIRASFNLQELIAIAMAIAPVAATVACNRRTYDSCPYAESDPLAIMPMPTTMVTTMIGVMVVAVHVTSLPRVGYWDEGRK
jgi:hypothetical protein